MKWYQFYDVSSSNYYYYNTETKETQWQAPSEYQPYEATDTTVAAPTSLKYDWGERQMNHYFNVDEFKAHKPIKKVIKPTKKQVKEFKKRNEEKKRKKKQWLFE